MVISCRNKAETLPHYFFSVNENLERDYCYLPGTYWIYRDSITGRMDSFAVVSTIYDSAFIAGRGDVWEEDNRIHIYDFNFDSPGSKPAIWEWELRRNELYIFNEKFSINFLYPLPFIIYPFENNVKRGYFNGECNVEKIPVFNVQSVSHTDVFEVHHYNKDAYFKYNHWFYMNSESGIIKMKLNTPTDTIVWELQRYHIVK